MLSQELSALQKIPDVLKAIASVVAPVGQQHRAPARQGAAEPRCSQDDAQRDDHEPACLHGALALARRGEGGREGDRHQAQRHRHGDLRRRAAPLSAREARLAQGAAGGVRAGVAARARQHRVDQPGVGNAVQPGDRHQGPRGAAEGDPGVVARSQGAERQGQGRDAARLLDLRRTVRVARGDGAVRPITPRRPLAAARQRRRLERAGPAGAALRRRCARAHALSGVDPHPRDGSQPHRAELLRLARLRSDRVPQDRSRAAQARRLSRRVSGGAARRGDRQRGEQSRCPRTSSTSRSRNAPAPAPARERAAPKSGARRAPPARVAAATQPAARKPARSAPASTKRSPSAKAGKAARA